MAESAEIEAHGVKRSAAYTGIVSWLTAAQGKAFETFSERCKETRLSRRPNGLSESELSAGINDEVTWWRFLRARKYNVDDAFAHFETAMALRVKSNVLETYSHIDVAEYDDARKLCPHWTGRRDKRGLPICIFDIAHLSGDTITKYKSSTNEPVVAIGVAEATLRALAANHGLTRLALPLCSIVPSRPNPNVPISACLYLADISALTFKQVWTIRNWVQDTSKLLADSYPEVIDQVLVLGAPYFFAQAWKAIKDWIDPVTATKIRFLSAAEQLTVLKEYVDEESIPKRYGGKFECYHGMLPDLDEQLKAILKRPGDGEVKLPVGPLRMELEASGQFAVMAVGSTGNGLRREKIAVSVPVAAG